MKKALLLLVLALCSLGAYAMDIEGICRMRIEQNTNRAQWGLDMRKDMLAKCKSKNTQGCSQPYLNAIDKQETKDKETVVESFRITQADPTVKMLLLAQASSDTTAALRGLRGTGASAKEIAYRMYSECVSNFGAAQGRNVSQPDTLQGNSSGCNTYTIIGQNGNTQYCQKCCYGTPNCQVTCY